MCASCAGVVEETVQSQIDAEAGQRFEFAVPGMSCGACVARIERELCQAPGVASARANLTLKRVVVTSTEDLSHEQIVEQLKAMNFDAYRIDDAALMEDADKAKARALLKALAVAGFGAANIMLLSVSAWSGADGSTRDLLHLISGLIAVPIVAFAGQPFFRSALFALVRRRVNMDVPISLAVLLATGMSIFQTITSQPEVYFDAAVMLLFFLLIGRYLDQLMRARARSAVLSLSEYAARDALQVLADGATRALPVSEIEPGMALRILPGGRVPVDCTVLSGISDIDRSMVTGESEPVSVGHDERLEGGVLNLTGALDVRAERPADQSFLAEISRMLDAAERGKGVFVGIADRAAAFYTPAVHATAALAFIGWMVWTGGDWQTSLLVAITTLIITCPCALALAVPVAHVVAASRLFHWGLLMRNGGAIERLATIGTVVFDKTGTLTMGSKIAADMPTLNDDQRAAFASLAGLSSHPAAAAIAHALQPVKAVAVTDVQELPGIGIAGDWNGDEIALQRGMHGTAFILNGVTLGECRFAEELRPGAAAAIRQFQAQHIETRILSGDTEAAVLAVQDRLVADHWSFGQLPAEKVEHISRLRDGSTGGVLMVGDGINDAPALAAANVSIAPSSGSDVGRQAADFVLTHSSLAPIANAVWLARKTSSVVKQNFGIALCYNVIAVPLAVMGFVTPLIAAIAMSASSIVVIANSLRLSRMEPSAKMANAKPGAKVAVAQPTNSPTEEALA